MSPLSSLAELASDWILAALGVAGTGLTILGGLVKGNYSRSTKNERRLEGDPDDPNYDGVMEIAKRNGELSEENGEKIDQLEEHMNEQHEELVDRIDDLTNNDD